MTSYANLVETIESIEFNEISACNFLKNLNLSEIILFLEEICGDQVLIERVASRSYTHQLNFEKFVLAKTKSGKSLRIHHWPSKIKSIDQDIHNHCASFASLILRGSLEHKHYKVCEGNEYLQYSYVFDDLAGVGKNVRNGSTGARSFGGDKVDSGSIYFVDKELLHQVVSVEASTITISFWNERNQHACVLQSYELEKLRLSKTAGIDSDQLSSKIGFIIKKLKEQNDFIRY
jgi:hypothetical protein